MQRIRSFCFAAIAIAYFYAARAISLHAAAGLASADWFDLVYRILVLFLVLVGYGVMGYVFQRQRQPIAAMGLVHRTGWIREFGLGAALGWAIVLASILPVVVMGGLYVTVWTAPRQWFLLLVDLGVLLLWSLTEEVVFRGYPFQRLIEAVGPSFATLLIAVLAAVLQVDAFAPGSSMWVAFFFAWLLCVTYLRTRALWVAWGLRFAWYAAIGLLFGLPIEGISRYSPVIQSTARGPEWLTGFDYGPSAAFVTVLVLIAAFYFLLRTTREYAHRYAMPEIVAAGIPVDIDALSRRQHEQGIGPVGAAAEAAQPKLVQIGAAMPPQGPPQFQNAEQEVQNTLVGEPLSKHSAADREAGTKSE